ncbi:DNA-binding PucR family transcriptional regulator [Kibdelosporangium banguiense]|uniref:DNA-binding PucR family transcriptional regulator n=1 Tax=Kibdelosporangium banguiense TaxID=1365924 RepID=A0ABS4TNW5_9PSEU|nr:helix-turn-helix domain-containing protein [Kibdelosporangium banguiense]MBP2326091.1 DNA-binding PucR family transcriptional regulator [Kibdelosporangium banguiense]
MTVRAVLDDLAREPARLDALVDRLVAKIRGAVPEYATIPEDVLWQGNRWILGAAVGHLRDNRLPDAAELREITKVGADRARQGISLEAVLAAYRVSGEEFWKVLSTAARDRGASDGSLLSAVELVWQWLDFVTVAAAAAHRDVEVRGAREDEQRIGDAVRALLTQPGADTRRHLWQLGLDPAGRFAALRGRLALGTAVSTLRENMPANGLVVAAANREVLGLVASVEALDPRFGTFGIGPLGPAVDLPASYLTAGRVLTAALRLGLAGSHRLDSLRVACVVATDLDMTRILHSRILAPLEAKGAYGKDIWRSVLSYVENGLRVGEAAAALHVHPNTVRHRLAHFTELTGVTLRDPADLSEIWWLMVSR